MAEYLKDNDGNFSFMRIALFLYMAFASLLLAVITSAWIYLKMQGIETDYPENVAIALITSLPISLFTKAVQKFAEVKNGVLTDEIE